MRTLTEQNRARENGKTIEQQRREDLTGQPTVPGFFGEPLPNPYYCPMAINSINKGLVKTNSSSFTDTLRNSSPQEASPANLMRFAQEREITALASRR